jgi:membrane protease YdiL (CAAX protease family)
MRIVSDRQVSIRELVTFFTVTLILSAAYVLLSGPMVSPGVGYDKALSWYREKAKVIIWAPMLFALLTVILLRGMAATLEILKRLAIWNVGLKWWLVVLLLPPATILVPAMIEDNMAQKGIADLFAIWLNSFLFLFAIIIGEELGWRGYALPGLQAHMTPFMASLILGVLWGLWHYPVWFGLEYGISGDAGEAFLSAVSRTTLTVTIGFLLTWVANYTCASIVIAMVYHAANNATMRLLDSTELSVLYYGLLAVIAVVVVLFNRNMFFARPDEDQNRDKKNPVYRNNLRGYR